MKKIFPLLASILFMLPAVAQLSAPIDPTFKFKYLGGALAGYPGVSCLALYPDGKIIIGGTFFYCNILPRKCIARLNSDGSIDSTFSTGTGVVEILGYDAHVSNPQVTFNIFP